MDPDDFLDRAAVEDFICVLCLSVQDNPTSMGCAEGHTFCHDCISTSIATAGSCPVCRDTPAGGAVISRSAPVRNMISKLVVRCVHHREAIPAAPKRRRPPSATSMTVAGLQAALADRGLPQSGLKAALVARLNDARDSENKCTWVGTMEGRPNHRSICKFAEVGCQKCHATVPRHALAAHAASCSPACQYCSRDFSDKPMLQAHLDAGCPKVEVTCPTAGCDATMLREDLPHHAAEVCPKACIRCPYAAAGCRLNTRRDAMAAHVRNHQEEHLAMAMRTIEQEPPHTTELLFAIDDAARHIREKTPFVKWFPRSLIGPNGYKVKISARFDRAHEGVDSASVDVGMQPGPNDHALGWPFPRTITVAPLLAAPGPAPVALTEDVANRDRSRFVRGDTTLLRGTSLLALSDLSTGCIGLDGKLRIRIRFSKLPRELTSTMVLHWTIDAVEGRFGSGVMRRVRWYPDCTVGDSGYQVQLRARFSEHGVGVFIGTFPGPFDDELEWPFVHGCTMAVLDRGGGVGGAPLHVVRQHTVASVRDSAGGGPEAAFNKGSTHTRGWRPFMSLAALKSRPGYLKGNQLRIRITFT